MLSAKKKLHNWLFSWKNQRNWQIDKENIWIRCNLLFTAWWWIVDGGLCNGLPWWPGPDIVAVVDPLEFCPGWCEWWSEGWSGAREMPGEFDMANGCELIDVGPLASNLSAFIISTIILFSGKQIYFSLILFFCNLPQLFWITFILLCILFATSDDFLLMSLRFPPSLYIRVTDVQ